MYLAHLARRQCLAVAGRLWLGLAWSGFASAVETRDRSRQDQTGR